MSIWFLQELLISTLLALLVPLYLYLRRSNIIRSKSPAGFPTNWPVLHMFPSLLANLFNVHDYLTIVLAGSGHNFRAHGPPGTGMRFFITCDPANVRHIFTTNYANFPKGEDFAAIFDIMVGSLFTVDGEPCRQQRAKMQSVLRNPRLVVHVAASCRDKVEKGLIPLFTHMASSGTPFDLQEVITRFMFDLTATMIFSVDPGLLSADMPPMDVAAAMDTVPAFCWKVMRRLSVGPERKLEAAQRVLRGFVAEMITQKRKMKDKAGVDEDILSSYIDDPNFDDDLLRSTLFSSMLAGRDTLGMTLLWFLYNLAQNPKVVSSIRNELSSLVASHKVASGTGSADAAIVIFEPEETKSLVYLRAALYETLRLYPPGPFERKTVAADDTMPSGHGVRAGDTIIVSLHSMGRMEGVWGKDCLDYNPDRWLSESSGDGGAKKLRYVPSHKFLAFNSGPRMCIGKDIAVMEMATIVAAVVWNFDVQVLEGQTIQPKLSCVLQMKHGLKVEVKKREI